MKNSHKRWFLLLLMLMPLSLQASSYKSVRKKYTKHKTVYSIENMEARLIWNVTYFSPEFREKLEEKLKDMGLDEGLSKDRWWVEHELVKGDAFFVSLYEGSAEWSEIGKEDGSWRFQLIEANGVKQEAKRVEKIKVTQTERALFPYLDKWSHAYLVIFPKKHSDEKFELRLLSPSANSSLKWTIKN